MAGMRNLHGMRAGQKTSTTSSCPMVIVPIDPQGSPVDCQPPLSVLGVGTEVAKPDNGPLVKFHLW